MPYFSKKSKKVPIQRDNLIVKDPATVYDGFDSEPIGIGKMSQVKVVTDKRTGKRYAAKCMRFYDGDMKFAVRELDVMTALPKHEALPQLHEAYLVRKYLILIMDLVEGKNIAEYFAFKPSYTEYDIADVIRQLCDALDALANAGIIYCDLSPTNIRIVGGQLKLLDYNTALKKGDVADVIGDTEFCPPEMLNFDPVSQCSSMWSVGVLAYTLVYGSSPFFDEDEEKAVNAVSCVQYRFDNDAYQATRELKEFIKKCLIRAPELRMTASKALVHNWLTTEKTKSFNVRSQETLKETSSRLLSEEAEEYVEASFVFRTFEQEEYDTDEE